MTSPPRRSDRPRTGAARLGRAAAALAVLVVLTLGGGVLHPSPAGAHAQVLSTDPADGVRLTEAPTSVSVTFSEEVSAELGGLTVLDSGGARVDDGDVEQPRPDQIRVGLEEGLGEDTFIATYRVVSADGHPIAGSWVFAVGERTSLDIDPATITPETDTTWEVLGNIGRGVFYAGTLLAAGGALFLAFVLDGDAGTRRLRSTVVLAAVVGACGLALWTAAQGALASGLGTEAAIDPDVLEIVLRDTMGWTVLATTAGLVGIVVATRLRHRAAAQTVGFYGAVAVLAGYVLWGHATAAENRWLAIGADLLHSAVAAIWFGGLVMLGLLLAARGRLLAVGTAPEAAPDRPPTATRSDRPTLALAEAPRGGVVTAEAVRHDTPALVTSTGETVARFSQVAAWSVGLLWVAGLVLTWLGTGGIDGLFGSAYGRLVLAKGAVVAVVLVVAGWNRRVLVPAIAIDAVDAEEDPSAEPDRAAIGARWALLRRAVRAEALALLVVVGITGVLVNTAPAVDDPTGGGSRVVAPFNSLVALEGTDTQLQINVVPGSTGENDIHLSYYDTTGLPADVVQSVDLELELPEKGIAPIERAAQRAGPGHYLWGGDALSIAGTWTIRVISRVSEFEEVTTEFAVPVAP